MSAHLLCFQLLKSFSHPPAVRSETSIPSLVFGLLFVPLLVSVFSGCLARFRNSCASVCVCVQEWDRAMQIEVFFSITFTFRRTLRLDVACISWRFHSIKWPGLNIMLALCLHYQVDAYMSVRTELPTALTNINKYLYLPMHMGSCAQCKASCRSEGCSFNLLHFYSKSHNAFRTPLT